MKEEQLKKHLNRIINYKNESSAKLNELGRCPYWRFFKFNRLIKEHSEIMKKWDEEIEILKDIKERK